jgi:crotonobetainyl-CoA:carnitine CoA-transferase CaiB-like acyl-CoA transferase
MAGPLDGVRILDMTHVLNGPFCTMVLAHMGAEVLKVEYGEGDRFRHIWMPPVADRDGYEFLMVNANKKGISINLKHPKGKKIFQDLAAQSDVVAENFTVGVMDRLGVGYEALKAINPRIIYASTKGYGESGPYKNVRANAGTINAISGWTWSAQQLAGRDDIHAAGIGDEAAGISLCIGILGALYAREQTGEGQKIEVSMQEALLGFMVSTFHRYFENQSVGGLPKKCADGYYAVSTNNLDMTDDAWAILADAMDRSDLKTDPEFATPAARHRNRREVDRIVSEWIPRKTRQEIWDVLSSIGLSSAPVLSLGEVLEDRQLKARGAFVDVEHPEAGNVKLLAPWIRFSGTPTRIERPSPLLGQHNEEVYGNLLGLSPEEVKSLAAEGAI